MGVECEQLSLEGDTVCHISHPSTENVRSDGISSEIVSEQDHVAEVKGSNVDF